MGASGGNDAIGPKDTPSDGTVLLISALSSRAPMKFRVEGPVSGRSSRKFTSERERSRIKPSELV